MRHYPLRCTKCKIPKAAEDFSPRAGHTYRTSGCKQCAAKAYAARKAANRERYLAIQSASSRRYRQRHASVDEGAKRRRLARQQQTPATQKHASEWTSTEMEIAARKDLTAVEVATRTGRTAYAVERMRHLICTDPKKARLAGLDTGVARLADPGTINIAPHYELTERIEGE